MKNTIFLLSVLFLAVNSQHTFAQQKNEYGAYLITVEDMVKGISKGEQPGFKVDIYQVIKKDVESEWSKAIRQNTKSKVENVNNEISIRATTIKQILPDTINIYSIINEYRDHVELIAFFEAKDIFFTKEKNESEYLAAKKFVRDFAVAAYKEAVEDEIDAEEKKLKSLESELDKIHKENDKFQKNINGEKHEIDNLKEKIATSELDQERVRKQIQVQKAKVAQVKTGGSETVVKEEENVLKDLEKELEKLMKQEDGLHKDVTKSEAEIRQSERDIADNEQADKLKQDDLYQQKELINKLQKKLESIN